MQKIVLLLSLFYLASAISACQTKNYSKTGSKSKGNSSFNLLENEIVDDGSDILTNDTDGLVLDPTSDPTSDPTGDPESPTDPEVKVVEPKVCCLCMHWNEDTKNCYNKTTVAECEATEGSCVLQNGACIGKFQAMCNNWMKDASDSCDWSGIAEQPPVGAVDENGNYIFTGEYIKGIIPENCTTLRIQQFTHSNEHAGCNRLEAEIEACIEASPELIDLVVDSVGCRTFDDRIRSDEFINQLHLMHPNLTFVITSMQDYVVIDHINMVCQQTSRKTYTVKLREDPTISYEPCSNPSSKYCDSRNHGQSKVCEDENGNPKNVVCCCNSTIFGCEYEPGLVCGDGGNGGECKDCSK